MPPLQKRAPVDTLGHLWRAITDLQKYVSKLAFDEMDGDVRRGAGYCPPQHARLCRPGLRRKRTPVSPEVLDDIRNLLYAGYHTENVDMSGADGQAKFLRSKNHKYLPDDVVKRCDDQVRKQIENEGGSPTNPVRRNGYRRTLQAEPEEVLDSVLTRRRTTDTRRLGIVNRRGTCNPN